MASVLRAEPDPSECKTWRDKARFVIGDAYAYWANCRGERPSPKMPEADKAEFVRYLRRHYPFGPRRHFPYKVWLSEVRKVKEWLYFVPGAIDTGLFGVPEGEG